MMLHESRKLVSDTYFHLSDLELETLEPREPDNILTSLKKERGGARISAAPSIEKCLIGFGDPYLGDSEPEFFVYAITNIESYKTHVPTKSEVPDKDLADEIWILEPVKPVCQGKIRVLRNRENHKSVIGPRGFANRISVWTKGQEYLSFTWEFEWIALFEKC